MGSIFRSGLIGIACFLAISSDVFGANCGEKDGVKLPCYRSYLSSGEGKESLPYYPYAKRKNGCSIPGARPGANDRFGYGGINISFRDICNKHDICYYTLGTTPWQCNNSFQKSLRARCEKEVSNHKLNGWDILTAGGNRAAILSDCYARAATISAGVIGAQTKYHREAQKAQKNYLNKVKKYVRDQKNAKKKCKKEMQRKKEYRG